jgi:hypothetical protein
LKLVDYLGEHSSGSFSLQNGLKQGESLLPLLLAFALEYAIRKAQKIRWDCQPLVYPDDVNLLGKNNKTKENRNSNTRKDTDLQMQRKLHVC